MATIKRVSWKWDRAACVLWASVDFSDGHTASVGIPLSEVALTFNAAAQEVGLPLPEYVGDVESVDGLFSSIKSAVKGARKLAKKAVSKAVNRLEDSAKLAATVVRSKYTTAALGAVAVAFPAVGGPALLAQQAAIRAAKTLETGRQAVALVQSGVRTASVVRAARQAPKFANNVRRLAASNTPAARMAVAALRSTRA